MNILFCGDRNVEKGVLLSMLSILKHNSEPLEIYILTMSFRHEKVGCEAMRPEFAKVLEAEMRKRNARSRVHFFDISEVVAKDLPEKNLKTVFTPCCMLRLYADLIPEIPEKILYLDTDVLARGPIRELYETEVSEVELAGVLDNYGQHFFHQKSWVEKDYLNSGVLVLNMKKIRETGLFLKCREHCKTHKMFMPDQSALNKFAESKKFLPRKWNEQKEMREDTVLRHFTTTVHFLPYFHVQTIKPWDVERLHKRLKTFEFDDIIGYYQKNFREVD